MAERHYYQYAFARPGGSLREIGPGVDPRFEVELVPSGPIAAVTSRVGLDQFDVTRLQGENADDVAWLERVAIRHNEIVCHAAKGSPVLPLRLGTIFRSRASLLAAAARCRETVADFLHTVGDRQEWAVKVYQEKPSIEQPAGHPAPPPPHPAPTAGAGTAYLKRKRARLERRRQSQAGVHREIEAVEHQLRARADRCRRVRPLPASLTGRREKMVFHAAFLVAPPEAKGWLATVGQVREAVRPRGLLVEVTGPWPPYHFCPTPEL